jgi:hypothetical protein
VEAGYRGAQKRWGSTPVRVFIGDLPDAVRADIMARVEAERRAQERESVSSEAR